MDQSAKRMGDYEILSMLGSGGMGRVYKVRNVITDRIEAMKVLLPDLGGHEDVAARFLREIKLLAALKHPNIAPLHTALTIDNQLVMIMEYVEGSPLSSRLASGAIPVLEALNYTDQVLDALSYAHQQNIIHRDIKPANMMVTPDGTVKLMDFGIARGNDEPAKLTATGTTLGSINYMSPEQVKGEPTDERSDIYSLGIALYEMVTGEKPFHGDSNFSIMAAQVNQAPTPPIQLHPGLPNGLNEIILTAIAKSPAERFQSADAFRNAVRQVLQTFQGQQGTMIANTAQRAAVASTIAAAASPSTGGTAVAPARTVPSAPAVTNTQPPASHRGLYVALGAFLVLVVLIAAGIYLPTRNKAAVSAGADSSATVPQPQATVTAQEIQSPAPVGAVQNDSTAAQSADESGSTSESPIPAKKAIAKSDTAQPPSPPEASAPAGPSAAELDELEHQIDQLFSRAAAVNSSLDRMQQEQARMGLGLRGDVIAKQSAVKDNLAKAQSALERNDYERAKRFSTKAESDIESLERFLGR